jgi:hypothetical protein
MIPDPTKIGSVYSERVSSSRTAALFFALSLLFLILFARRQTAAGLDLWGVLFLSAFAFFLFYAINYRALVIHVTQDSLQLSFGIFRWTVPLENISACYPDRTSLWRIGGAGIHFSFFAGRYRAMFNFLQHSRLVIALPQKRGPVQELAFSTRHPEELMALIKAASCYDGDA